jgi:hypothetical protein
MYEYASLGRFSTAGWSAYRRPSQSEQGFEEADILAR